MKRVIPKVSCRKKYALDHNRVYAGELLALPGAPAGRIFSSVRRGISGRKDAVAPSGQRRGGIKPPVGAGPTEDQRRRRGMIFVVGKQMYR